MKTRRNSLMKTAEIFAEQTGTYGGALSAVSAWLTHALALPAEAQGPEMEAIRDYIEGALNRGSAISNGLHLRPEGIRTCQQSV